MSATFRFAKKQYSQNDLRRLMQEQKSKNKQATQSQARIDSPLAKYNDAGQLTCILCKSIVRSENVWKVHINSKAHKENVEAAKKLKEKLQTNTVAHKRTSTTTITSNVENIIPEKKLKSEDSNKNDVNNEKSNSIPSDFFDLSNSKKNYFEHTLNKTSIKKDLVNIKRDHQNQSDQRNEDTEKMDIDDESIKNELLPEGFFDDPVKDAKIRNLEYKDPQEEEWERFQREIKEESFLSNTIIAEEQDEATAERQIEEIDEQIQKWSKVLDLEKKKDDVSAKFRQKFHSKYNKGIDDDSNSSGTDDNIDDIEELLDWRAKRLKKIQK